jgi:GT2 family glycosyltransferase
VAHNPLDGEKPEFTFNLHLHDGSQEQVSIIIVHKDRPAHLNLLLQSIEATSFNNNYEIIVVDNGSGIEGQELLDDIKDEVKVVKNKENLYWSAAANKGAEVADKNSKYFVFMHCDTVVLHPNWLDTLMNVSESKKSGLVGIEMGKVVLDGQPVEFVQEWCMLVTRECWKDAGPFPLDLPVAGHAFVLSFAAAKKGYLPQCYRIPLVHHYRVFTQSANEFERMAEQAAVIIPRYIRDLQQTSVSPKGL